MGVHLYAPANLTPGKRAHVRHSVQGSVGLRAGHDINLRGTESRTSRS